MRLSLDQSTTFPTARSEQAAGRALNVTFTAAPAVRRTRPTAAPSLAARALAHVPLAVGLGFAYAVLQAIAG